MADHGAFRRRISVLALISAARRPRILPSGLLVAVITVAGCVGSAGRSSSGPAGTGTIIDHRSGSTDVVLRLDQVGGFVPPAFLVTRAPIFTLYGDGMVLARESLPAMPPPTDGVRFDAPFIARLLTGPQVQALLVDAIGPGGLGRASAKYDSGQIADAPTSRFTLRAGGFDKTVEVVGLGIDHATADSAIVASLAALAKRLEMFGAADGPASSIWVPARFRSVLVEGGGDAPPKAWPWPELRPSDWAPRSADAAGVRTRTLTRGEVAALGLGPLNGGLNGLSLLAPDGQPYTLGLRPLLPDEGE